MAEWVLFLFGFCGYRLRVILMGIFLIDCLFGCWIGSSRAEFEILLGTDWCVVMELLVVDGLSDFDGCILLNPNLGFDLGFKLD
jgi:hypothetical protein